MILFGFIIFMIFELEKYILRYYVMAHK